MSQPAPITAAQLQALRSIAREAPNDYPMVLTLCDRVDRLQTIEAAALRLLSSPSQKDRDRALLELGELAGIPTGMPVHRSIAA